MKVEKYQKGFKYEKDGWIFVHIEGEPFERGFQYGYLIAEEYIQTFKCYDEMMFQSLGIDMQFVIENANKLYGNKMPKEILEELKGIAQGITAKGYNTTLEDIIGWNAWMDITEGYWPKIKPDFAKYVFIPSQKRKEKCSAFIATGNATKDKKIVIAHSTFDDFWNVQNVNLILDIKPSKGKAFVMQATPGYVASLTDFFVSSAGIVGVETSFVGFNGFDETKLPAFIRQRIAMQYAENIDQFIELLNKENNAGNPASWLLGDINSNEIVKFEQGLIFSNIERKKDGYFFGCNIAFDPKIRNLECDGSGYNDIRRHTGGRKVRFETLLEKYFGKIDIQIAKAIMSDHYDVYQRKNFPGANTVCAHYDNDKRKYMSSSLAVHPEPFSPSGAVDCKISNSAYLKQMGFIARFGRPCGIVFNAEKFLKKQPQWNWQKKYLKDREHKSWTTFSSYKK
ncbi:MAG: hypothetical protein A2888_00185 [Chlamydiae bacterium RIFCSPLOWO2_01_FULL_28_7]|nr:MAG: hypothetical protein A2888_00185 [Chlamydiae bacterium RIFCSPLOWO2_01_FULL_28_7]